MPRRRQPVKKENTNLIVIGVIAAVVLVVGLLLVNAVRNQPKPATPIASGSRDWGNANAPVTIEDFSDFQ